MSTVGHEDAEAVPDRFYAYATIIGLGIGTCLSTITLISRAQSTHHDHSVNMSAISSLRTIGGTISISIGHIVMSNHLVGHSSKLLSVLSQTELDTLARDPAQIPAEFTREQVSIIRDVLGNSFRNIWLVMLAFALATFVLGCGCWVRHPVDLQELDRAEAEDRERLDRLAHDAPGDLMRQKDEAV